jgi:hypothetical protein
MLAISMLEELSSTSKLPIRVFQMNVSCVSHFSGAMTAQHKSAKAIRQPLQFGKAEDSLEVSRNRALDKQQATALLREIEAKGRIMVVLERAKPFSSEAYHFTPKQIVQVLFKVYDKAVIATEEKNRQIEEENLKNKEELEARDAKETELSDYNAKYSGMRGWAQWIRDGRPEPPIVPPKPAYKHQYPKDAQVSTDAIVKELQEGITDYKIKYEIRDQVYQVIGDLVNAQALGNVEDSRRCDLSLGPDYRYTIPSELLLSMREDLENPARS